MKNKNPYLISIILLVLALAINITNCIIGIVLGSNSQAIFALVLSVAGSIFLGFTIFKYYDYKTSKDNFNRLMKSFDKIIENRENEPFEEFKNESQK